MSSGEGSRISTRDVSRGVMVRQGAHAEVVKRVNKSVLFEEMRRRASWKFGGVRKGVKTRFVCEWKGVVLNEFAIGACILAEL